MSTTVTLSLTDYLETLQKSKLIELRELKELLGEYQSECSSLGEQPNTLTFAKYLIEKDKITEWQQEKLKKNRYKGFFLGKYKLLDHLGSGGMGAVYLAEHTLMARRAAIKVFPKQNNDNSSLLARFIQEAQAIAALDHPHIVQAYNIDSEKSVHYLVMEYVEGRDLEKIVKEDGVLSPEDAAEYIAQAADGLSYAEQKGIIHRDIKPANLLLDKQKTVKLLDMGLARLTDDENNSLTRKHDENVIGTTDYMAPEQAIDSHAVDHRADIYSLGGTLYYLLVGTPPFPEGTIAQRLMKHQTQDPEPISGFRDDVPQFLIDACSKMMAKSPDDRYQSAQEIRDELNEWNHPEAHNETLVNKLSTSPTVHDSGLRDEVESAPTPRFEPQPQKENVIAEPVSYQQELIARHAQKKPSPIKITPKMIYIGSGVLSSIIVIVLLYSLFSGPATDENVADFDSNETVNPFLFPEFAVTIPESEKISHRVLAKKDWKTFIPQDAISQAGQVLGVSQDGKVLATDRIPWQDTMTLIGPAPVKKITAIKLTGLPHDSHKKKDRPGRHPNGEFVVSRFSARLIPKDRYGVEAKKIVLQQTSGEPLHIAEVEVFQGKSNIASLNSTVSQSSTSNGAEAKRAIDNDTDGTFNKGSVTHTNGGANQSWTLEFANKQRVDRIVIWNRTDCCQERLNGLNVIVQDENEKEVWRHVFDDAQFLYNLDMPLYATKKLKFAYGKSQASNAGMTPDSAIDGLDLSGSGWSPKPSSGEKKVFFVLSKPVEVPDNMQLEVTIEQLHKDKEKVLGHFKLDLLDDESVIPETK